MKRIAPLFFSLGLLACAQVPLAKQTQSGYAEATYTTDIMTIQNLVVGLCADRNMRIYQQSANQVVCGKTMEGGGSVLAQLALGNAYSTTPVYKVRFSLYQIGSDVRVIAYPSIETQMPGGQVNSLDTTNVNDRNNIQMALDNLQQKIPQPQSLSSDPTSKKISKKAGKQ